VTRRAALIVAAMIVAAVCAPPMLHWSQRAVYAIQYDARQHAAAERARVVTECTAKARAAYDAGPNTGRAWRDYQRAYLACGNPMPDYWHNCQANNPDRPDDWQRPPSTAGDPFGCGGPW
jgi:hypothetical protein